MNRHPAHQIAETVMYAAEELRGYMNPDDPFPWELTEDDHSRSLAAPAERDLRPSLNASTASPGNAGSDG